MPEETKAAPLAPILTPGAREGEVEEEEEGEKEGEEAREKLLGRVGFSGCPAPVAMDTCTVAFFISCRRQKKSLDAPLYFVRCSATERNFMFLYQICS